jgi:hypothetical protein
MVRHHLATLCRHDELQPGLVDVHVVDLSLEMVYRYIKGRVYEKPLRALDPVLQASFDQQQIVSLTHAESIHSPYQETPFAHQYLHIYPLEKGLLLIQQDDFHPLPASISLLAQSIDILLAASIEETKVTVYEDWLRRSGMNQETGSEQFLGQNYTPRMPVTFDVDADGCYPVQAMPMMTKTDSVIYVQVSAHLIPALVKAIDLPVYRAVDGCYLHVSTTDKRTLNKLASTLRDVADEPFSELIIHIVRGCDTPNVIEALTQMRDANDLYYPPRPPSLIMDVNVALARVKRYRVRNEGHQWVMTYYELPSMSLACEREVLTQLLKEKTSTFRLIPISETLSQHPDTVRWMNKHKMAQYMNKTGFVVNLCDQALLTYLTQKSGTIGCSRWDVYFQQPRDYIVLDRSLSDQDSGLIELLFDRQMKHNVIPIVPVRSAQDILVLTNHQLGYYYSEEDHE